MELIGNRRCLRLVRLNNPDAAEHELPWLVTASASGETDLTEC